MSEGILLSLRADISLTMAGPTTLQARWGSGVLRFEQITPEIHAAFERLQTGAVSDDELLDPILTVDDEAAARFCYFLRMLTKRCLVLRTVRVNDDPLASVIPISPYFDGDSGAVVSAGTYVLSRFAYVRRQDDHVVLESPLCHARVTLHHWLAAAAVQMLAQPVTAQQVSTAVQRLSPNDVGRFMTMLLRAGFLIETSHSATPSPEDDDDALRCWEFHDLLFHARSREGRHDYPTGATYRFAGRIDPPPVLDIQADLTWLPLRQPDLNEIRSECATLEDVQTRRRSVRDYGSTSITLEQLGEFLFRVNRVTRGSEAEVRTAHGPVMMDFAFRPYPNSGAAYELELYVVAGACDGLQKGLYQYDPLNHRLGYIAAKEEHVEQLLLDASRATIVPVDSIQTVVVITARFQRVAWKYESIAYALTLKNAGVLLQTMYLVAAAMGLGPCAIGCGNADVFAEAAGTHYCKQTSVGEFLLGGSGRLDDGP